ncbi:myelin regulatory factor, partial [Paramuricea clavata]
MDFDIGSISLDFFSEHGEIGGEGIGNPQHDDWQGPQYLDGDHPTFETFLPAEQPSLPLSPPNSCPVTPTEFVDKNFELKEADFAQSFLTDAPELELYLRQTNPLVELKRKSQLLDERNENNSVKKVRTNNHCKTTDHEELSPQRTIKWSDYKTDGCHKLFTSSLNEPTTPSLVVTCDKGLSFSPAESVFICQKKNHFQVSLNLEITSDSQTRIQVEDACEDVICYKVHLYAIK